MNVSKRYKVKVFCNRCGESFTLRGKRNKQGKIETGLKQCLCNNTDDFEIIPLDEG